MKKYFAFMLAAAAAVVACNKENIENSPADNSNADVRYVDASFSATIEGQVDTKTSVNIGEDNKATVSWSNNDKISVFDNAAESTNKHNNVFTWNGSEFNGTLPEPGVSSAVYALYPYRTGATIDGNKISTTLFAEQNARAGSFANNIAIMAGKITDGAINFKNICSHIKFNLTEENVKSITLMGNKNEALCGTFDLTWNGDEPVIAITRPETYVTVRNNNGTALSAGNDYYITTLPIEFAEGFTIILSYMDGSQKIKSLSKNISLERRKISPLSTPKSFDEGRVNYFVLYNDGFNVTVGDVNNGGVTFSKSTNPGGVLVNATKGNTQITKDGVYFLCREKTPAQSKYNETNGVIFCGTDSFTKAPLEINASLQPATNADGLIIFNNLEITPAESFSNDFISQKKQDANPCTEFGSIIFNDCKITTSRHLIYILNEVIKINKVSIFDCDFFTQSAQSCIISFGAYKASTISELNITNNIFCAAPEKTVTDFKILQGAAATVNNINLYSNTFDRIIILNAGCIIVNNVENCYMMYNLLNEVVAEKASNLGNYKGTATEINGNVTYNYYYTSGTLTVNNSLKPKTYGSPAKLTKSPLPMTWDPYNELYGNYDIEAVDETKKPGPAIIGKIGATRTPSATANSADYRNGKVDLGAF